MKTVIDNLDSVTGWSASAGAAITGLNDHKEFIAGDNTHSLILSFPLAGAICQKSFSPAITLAGNKMITLSLWSRINGDIDYQKYTDFVYKIEFGTNKVYYLPVHSVFTDVTFDVSDLTTIERIKITYLGSVPDYLVLSYAVMSEDELPVDIFNALKEKFDVYTNTVIAQTLSVGVLSAAVLAGAKFITLADEPVFAKRYSKIKITDGVNTEYHHIDRKDGKKLTFSSLYDGEQLLHGYAGGVSVYLCIPFEFGRTDTEIVFPSINVWGLGPEGMGIDSDVQDDLDTWKEDGSVNESVAGSWFKYPLLFDCESNDTETLALASKICRKLIAQKSIWVNGRQCSIDKEGPSVNVDAVEANEIPKIQYPCSITVKEDVWNKTRLPLYLDENKTFTIAEGGTL